MNFSDSTGQTRPTQEKVETEVVTAIRLNEYSTAPLYNIKAVVQSTSISPSTLRAWERRYNMCKPQRSESGYRLYSDRDVAVIRWLKAQVDAGMSISQAVAWLQSLTEEQGGEHDERPVPQVDGVRVPPDPLQGVEVQQPRRPALPRRRHPGDDDGHRGNHREQDRGAGEGDGGRFSPDLAFMRSTTTEVGTPSLTLGCGCQPRITSSAKKPTT